jgi:hypothetical protein
LVLLPPATPIPPIVFEGASYSATLEQQDNGPAASGLSRAFYI